MGKACVRFKTLDDIPLDVVGEVFRRQTAKAYIDRYVSTVAAPPARTRQAKGRKA
jgi:hypothetical protein